MKIQRNSIHKLFEKLLKVRGKYAERMTDSDGRRYIELKLSMPMAEIISTVMTCKYNRGTNYHTSL